MFSAVSSLISEIKSKLLHGKISAVKAMTHSTASTTVFDEETSSEPVLKCDEQKPRETNEPVRFSKLVKINIETCPNCSYYASEKTMHKYIVVEGPLFLKKDLAKENLRPLIKISEVHKCSKCGYEKVKRKMYIPLETIDMLEPLLCGDVIDVIDEVKNISSNIENLLAKFLG
mgnify:CR=1 FL=1